MARMDPYDVAPMGLKTEKIGFAYYNHGAPTELSSSGPALTISPGARRVSVIKKATARVLEVALKAVGVKFTMQLPPQNQSAFWL